MKIYFIILAILIFSEEHVLSQVSDSCNLWYGKKNEIAKKADTLKVKVKYMEINENIYFHPYPLSDKDNSFYRKLQEKYSLKLCLGFEPIGCDKGYCYPLIYKPKYEYLLFHKKNKAGKYQNWDEGQLIEITLVRFNRYFENSSELITIVTDISPLEGSLPVKQKVGYQKIMLNCKIRLH